MSVSNEQMRIVVIGASAGGLEAIKILVGQLPRDLPCAIFIVWHVSHEAKGILPEIINKLNTLPAAHAIDKEPIQSGRIYIAQTDRHLLIEKNLVRVTHGPKENRFRPAIDPLFRSAAYAYGPRVVGIILSGALDDGTAGLWTVKRRGGISIVQEPSDALVASMPQSALQAVRVDYNLPVAAMASLLVKIVGGSLSNTINAEEINKDLDKRLRLEVKIALQNNVADEQVLTMGNLSPYTCPECHGVLTAIKEGGRTRFRCHTGHAFSADSLLYNLTETIENDLWNVLRGIEESIFLLNQMGDQYAAANKPRLAAVYFKKAGEAASRAQIVKQVIQYHEELSGEDIEKQTGQTDKKI